MTTDLPSGGSIIVFASRAEYDAAVAEIVALDAAKAKVAIPVLPEDNK